MSIEKIQCCTSQLFDAHTQRKSIDKFATHDVSITFEEAYEIQSLLTSRKINENNEEIIGYKMGLTSVETQEQMNADGPFYGTLTDHNVSGPILDVSQMFAPKLLEMELMFLVDEDISPSANLEEIFEKTRIAPGFEIPDSRFDDWFPAIPLSEVVADSGVAGRIAVGSPVEYTSVDALKEITCRLHFNDEMIAEGRGEAVLGNPINSVLWLVKRLSEQGQCLRKGMVISSGTVIMPVLLKKGVYRAEFDSVGTLELKVI